MRLRSSEDAKSSTSADGEVDEASNVTQEPALCPSKWARYM